MEEIYKRISDDNEFGFEFTEKSEIQIFFAGQTIFLTGCTGFLGKCFVEKLLRGCPDIRRLYVAVRPFKSSASERMKKYFQHIIFDNLRQSTPNFESKVIAFESDLMQKYLGLSEDARNIIENEVTVMVHNASNVKFDGRVSKTLRSNVIGTQAMLNLAKNCKNLKIFTYVSTAYSHCYQQHIEEKCYPPPGNLQFIQDLIDTDEKIPDGITTTTRNDTCKPWPNIYVFSKATAESLIEEYTKHVPFRCVIFRPTIGKYCFCSYSIFNLMKQNANKKNTYK